MFFSEVRLRSFFFFSEETKKKELFLRTHTFHPHYNFTHMPIITIPRC